MKEKITTYQLFSMMFLLPYATAVLFYLAPQTKKAVWIALIFYSLLSLIEQSIYLYLFNKYPEDSIVTYLPKIYGRYIGFILGAAYIIYFLYSASRNLRDFIEIIAVFALPNESIVFTCVFLMITITYSVYRGIENIGSMSQISLVVLIIVKIILIMLLTASRGVFHYDRIFPIFEKNFLETMLQGRMLIAFPFGEFIVFTMLYPFVLQKSKIRKTVYFATIFEAVILAVNNIVFLFALGYNFATKVNYPLVETYRLIHIGEFLNRLEIFLLLVMVINGFFKISIFMYCGALGVSQIFKIKNWGGLCVVCGIIVSISSLLIARNYPQHVKLGLDVVIKYIHLPIQIGIPIITFAVFLIKSRLKRNVKE